MFLFVWKRLTRIVLDLEMPQVAKVVGGDVSFNLKMKCIDDILDTEILEMSKS